MSALATPNQVQNEPSTTKEPTYILHRTPWQPPVAVSGEGSYIVLEDGTRLLDAVGGAAVACIGNSHPKVIRAIKNQLDAIPYVYNMQLANKPAEALAKKLVDGSDGAFSLVGFASGGSEAMEGVLKLARQYYTEINQPQRTNFIARQLSFHGNTLGTLSLAYHPARRAPYLSLLDEHNFHHVSPAYARRFQGVNETEEEYVERLRQELEDKFIALGPDTVIGSMKSVCVKYGALFILDEVMSGMGRMGTLHAWQSLGDGAAPDLQAVAKGLGGGLQTASTLSQDSGNTGNPLACAAALAVQEIIEEENLLENIRVQGAYLGDLLKERLTGPNSLAAPFTFDIRGAGGFWGVEFDFEQAPASLDFRGQSFGIAVQAKALLNGLVIMGFSGGSSLDGLKGDHIILAPAYNIKKEEVENIVDLLVRSVEEVLRDSGL
ncbi:hypothetical protein D9611_006308 [Ephemerocybe angulata]|uniref:PLP-dependent transferase n=1 Tax=Ephemerocybe angulata TaxID=980116 RepID=A0A8H5C7G8_9AGAR|nr:hypothetical protein D9611_006308 [Tulosesus angulatus]